MAYYNICDNYEQVYTVILYDHELRDRVRSHEVATTPQV